MSASVFPNLKKQIILGIPWFAKENPHIDWTQAVVVVKEGQKWISMPLAKPKQQQIHTI